MRGDLVENRRLEEAIQRLQNLAIALGAFLVQVRVVAQVNVGERFERYIRLPPYAVAGVENARTLAGFDVLRLACRPSPCWRGSGGGSL
jgi:hypothetical protein